MKQTKNILIAFLFVFALAFVGAGTSLGGASVTTDQSDYAPGATAIITGAGFQPGNTAATTQACPSFPISPPA